MPVIFEAPEFFGAVKDPMQEIAATPSAIRSGPAFRADLSRLVGVELEFANLDMDRAESICKDLSSRSWEIHEDCSIPRLKSDYCSCCDQGEVSIDCDDCSGTGNTSVYCGNCLGNGTVTVFSENEEGEKVAVEEDCSECGGEGYVEGECSYCDGNGSFCEECEECQGTGWECNSPTAEVVSPPGRTPAFFLKIEEIFDAMVAEGGTDCHDCATGDSNHQTGLHVHVDTRDLTKAECVAVSIAFDCLLNDTEFVAKHSAVLPYFRLGNFYYCKRLHRMVSRTYNNRTPFFNVWESCQRTKYFALNFLSLRENGTLEFRVGYLPSNGQQAAAWAMECREVVERAVAAYRAYRSERIEGDDTWESFADYFEGVSKQQLALAA